MTKPTSASGAAKRAPGAGAPPRRGRRVDPIARGIWPFALPAVVVTAVLVLAPIAYTIWLSVSDRQADGTNAGFLGFANYTEMFADSEFWNALKVTVFLFAVCLIVETLLGLALGYVMSLDVPGRRIFQGMMLIPAITASVAVGLVWLLIMDPSLGAANQILAKVGVDPVVWLGDPDIAPWSIALVDIWQWTPFMALIIAAGIRSLPEEPFEAAAIDGASGWRTAWNVGLPLLRPVLTVAMLLRTVDLVRFFDTIYIMTQGGPVNATNTLNVYGYNTGFVDNEPSYAATLQIALLVLVVLIAGVFTWFRQRAAR
ncbi:carbohydrate ABC transporter permease [Paractinoplanes lichenicola]|uniref:Sugar ABC transporter permease n=1 Tax=Paractinoplanes lichenicola TaxID=2802976 RepID=A0ABS1VYH1_9ACTN|nr:sugar ABC transporter permease [Actinoplanes lichenicola]MBL7259468.1 sugar ABC transporter permease [Actinoplanes lichenicola]